MVAPAPILDLYTPGLAHAWPRSQAEGLDLPRLPAMERALSRGDVETFTSAPTLENLLLDAFGLPAHTGIAPFAWLGDCGRHDPNERGVWRMRADPVYLQADQDRALLFACEDLAHGEADALRTLLDPLLRDYGASLEMPTAHRWYLRLPDAPELETRPLHEVIGRDIRQWLPGGEQGKRWRALLTEIQMALHGAAVNEQRAVRGLDPVNSVWFWGHGRLPDASAAASPWDTVASDEPLARGLALWAQRPALDAPAQFGTWLDQSPAGTHLVVLETARRQQRTGDWQAWRDTVAHWERDWLAPALRSVSAGSLRALRWWPGGDGRFNIERRNLRRFWRRPRPLPWRVAELTP